MKLYNYFRSSASFRVRIALGLKGLAYDYVSVHLAKGEHLQAEFAQAAPSGLVPLLELQHEVAGTRQTVRLSQSLAMVEFLDELHPAPALLPPDPLGRARVRALAQLIACEIHPLNNLRVLKHLKNTLGQTQEAVDTWYRHWVAQGLTAFERELEALAQPGKGEAHGAPQGTFCYGNTPTLADCCLVPQIFNAQRFNCDLSAYPRTMAVFTACMALPAFDAAQPKNCPDAE